MTSLRMLLSANSPWTSSGYGVQSNSLLPRLANLPEFGGRKALSVFAWFGLGGGIIEYNGFRVYPKASDTYGNDVIGFHAADFGANWVTTLIDTWVLRDVAKNTAPALWTPYFPVDSTPVPQMVLDGIAGCYLPLVFSQWGKQELANAGVEATYIPLGLEPSIYRILPDDEVRTFRQNALRDPEHLTVMVAANKSIPDRKAFTIQLPAWAEFAKDKPGARIYLHTDPTRNQGGIDLVELVERLGIRDKCLWPKWYQYHLGYPPEFMALLYNAADVYLGAARGEGFGIPLIEAQASGCPVVTTNFSSMPELVRWGHAVPYAERDYTLLGAWQAIPDGKAITETLNLYYAEWEDNGRCKDYDNRRAAQDAIHAEYSWDVIVRDYWQPLAQRMAQVCPELDEKYRQPERPKFLGPQSTPEANGLHKLPVLTVEGQA